MFRGHSGEAPSIRKHVAPTPRHKASSSFPSFPLEVHAANPLGASNPTPPLGASNHTPPSVSPQSLQPSSPRTHETFSSHDVQNVSDVQSTSDKPVLKIDGYR